MSALQHTGRQRSRRQSKLYPRTRKQALPNPSRRSLPFIVDCSIATSQSFSSPRRSPSASTSLSSMPLQESCSTKSVIFTSAYSRSWIWKCQFVVTKENREPGLLTLVPICYHVLLLRTGSRHSGRPCTSILFATDLWSGTWSTNMDQLSFGFRQ